MSRIKFVFLLYIFILLFFVVNNIIQDTNYYKAEQIDEVVYKNTISNWGERGAEGLIYAYQNIGENKPISFLFIQKTIPHHTRTLNFIIIISITIIMFRVTGSYFSLFYPLIPLFLNSMWLTVEIIEILFILLAIKYTKYSGVFTGLAAIFRPYAIIYSVMLNKMQRVYFLIITGIFILIMFLYGILFEYSARLLSYGSSIFQTAGIEAFILLIPLFLFALLGDKTILKYGLLACFPLLFRTYGHYFLPAYSLFFMSCIQQLNVNTPNSYIYTENK